MATHVAVNGGSPRYCINSASSNEMDSENPALLTAGVIAWVMGVAHNLSFVDIGSFTERIHQLCDRLGTVTVDKLTANITSNLETYRGERSPKSRWASFDYCYNYFQDARDAGETERLKDDDRRQLSCLQLGFYLASWGMMRGSGQLLQNSLHGLVPVVKLIADEPPSTWELGVHSYTDHAAEVIDLRQRVWSAFGESDIRASHTLVTKTMLGVFGCVPAFDRYFLIGSGLRFPSEKSLQSIGRFYEENKAKIDAAQVHTLDFVTGQATRRLYPRAKIIDAVFFMQGFAPRLLQSL